MPVLIGALLVSLIFPMIIYFFLRNAHKEEDYRRDCRRLFLKGLLLCVPVFFFSLLCNILFNLTNISEAHPLVEAAFKAFVLAAFSEELMKYLLARGTIRKNLSTVSFLDLMAYTAASAIGFEIMEAVVYFFSTNIPQILVRGITSMHAAFGLTMGYFLARGIKKSGRLSMAPAVFITTLIHGTYNFMIDPLLLDQNWAWGIPALVIAFLCLMLNLYNFRFMSKARKDPYYTDPLFPQPSGAETGE